MIEDGDKIISIIPAPDWYAKQECTDGSIYYAPLCCWALVEKVDGTQEIYGMEAHEYVSNAEEDGGFKRYIYEKGDPI